MAASYQFGTPTVLVHHRDGFRGYWAVHRYCSHPLPGPDGESGERFNNLQVFLSRVGYNRKLQLGSSGETLAVISTPAVVTVNSQQVVPAVKIPARHNPPRQVCDTPGCVFAGFKLENILITHVKMPKTTVT